MRIAVSNIAWTSDDEDAVRQVLLDRGVDALEIAPTRIWSNPTDVSRAEARDEAARHRDAGLEIVAFQSLLFGHPELVLFQDEGARQRASAHMEHMLRLAGWMGAKRLVFGSPKNRIVPEGMTPAEADDIAVEFCRALAIVAQAEGTVLCIEPNPAAYGCNYVTTADEGADLVARVDAPGFALHLDIAGLTLAGDDPSRAADAHRDVVRHVHASAPQLGPIERAGVDHDAFAAALRESGYSGLVSIEMRAEAAGTNAIRVAAAIDVVTAIYAH